MTPPTYGSVWSTAYIDAHPLPRVPRDLLPWLKKDRREAETGGTFWNVKEGRDEHDKQGLHHAEREVRRIKSALDDEDPATDRAAILSHQLDGQEQQVEAWRGKCYLLDKVIAATEGGS